MKPILAGLALFGLVACTGPGGVSTTPVVATSVAAAEQSLTLAEKLALRYTSLPACGGPVVRICHEPAIKQKIKDLDNVAFNAVMAARRNEALLGLAVAAIGNLSSSIP